MKISLDGGFTWIPAKQGVLVDTEHQSEDHPYSAMTVLVTPDGIHVSQHQSVDTDVTPKSTSLTYKEFEARINAQPD